jgi:hypothetical protein
MILGAYFLRNWNRDGGRWVGALSPYVGVVGTGVGTFSLPVACLCLRVFLCERTKSANDEALVIPV